MLAHGINVLLLVMGLIFFLVILTLKHVVWLCSLETVVLPIETVILHAKPWRGALRLVHFKDLTVSII